MPPRLGEALPNFAFFSTTGAEDEIPTRTTTSTSYFVFINAT